MLSLVEGGRGGVLRVPRVWLLLAVAVLLVGGIFVVPRILTKAPGPSPPPAPQGPAGRWMNVMDDEFSGTSLNRTFWQPNRFGKDGGDAPFNPDQEAAWFSPSNVTVADGMLTLTLRSEPRRLLNTDFPYSSGMVQSPPSATFGPGSYVEARIAVPRCDGCWPAFWLDPSRGSPPEIDGFEFFDTSQNSQKLPSFTYHPPDGSDPSPSKYGQTDVDYRGDFHTYGILWTTDKIVPYLDGVAYPEVGATEDIAQGKLAIIMNLSVLADHQPADGSTMQVDWVRVWSQP